MRLTSALIVLTLLVPLAACAPDSVPPDGSEATRATGAPATGFQTEEEALVAAEEAYREFVRVGEAITAEGGAGPERMQPLTTKSFYEDQIDVYKVYVDREIRTSGQSRIAGVRLQSWDSTEIAVYACQDFTNVLLVDSANTNVTPPDRPRIATFEIRFVVVGSALLVDSSELWSRRESCF